MEIKFAKYHGIGNDFIILEKNESIDYARLAQVICNRKIGIGADGLIVVERSPLMMHFYNQDGSLGTMCGNGLRCFSKYVVDENIVDSDYFHVKTLAGIYDVWIKGEDVKVKMVNPDFSTTTLKMNTDLKQFINQELYGVKITCVFTGAVHGVVFVDDVKKITDEFANLLHAHPIFHDRANINFVQVLDNQNALMRTFERGVGWTLACGTGAVAAFVVGKLLDIFTNTLIAHFPYGNLQIIEEDHIYMVGSAVKIASGIYYFN